MLSDLESPDYESIIKATIKHSDAVIHIESLSKFNKIYRIFRKTFFFLKDEFAEAYQFYQERFYQIKILLANMYNNSFLRKF
jgi:starch synthase